ncbi:hypothetical protein Bca52824_016249 [Brassica carinata]|uniref:Uncharacterized protein n=1 Tax=Brassica carinata TaxID=52824 RepID=A0A8X7W4S3_BRACI|nr:hypothetical protein Bca52824_016249 [Brassica carinata]
MTGEETRVPDLTLRIRSEMATVNGIKEAAAAGSGSAAGGSWTVVGGRLRQRRAVDGSVAAGFCSGRASLVVSLVGYT